MRISDWSSDVCSSDLLFDALRGENFLAQAVGDAKAAVVGEQRQPFCGALDKLGHLPVRGERAEARAVGEVRVVAAEVVVAELAGDDPIRVRAVGNCAAGAVALSAVALSAVVLGAIVLGSAGLRSEEHTSELQSLMRI